MDSPTLGNAPDGLTVRHLRHLAVAPGAAAIPAIELAPPTWSVSRAHVRWSERSETASLIVWDFIVSLLVVQAALGRLQDKIAVASALAALAVPVTVAMLGGYRRVAWLRAHLVNSLGKLLLAGIAALWLHALIGTTRVAILPSLKILVALPLACAFGRWALSLVRAAHPERIVIVGGGIVAGHILELATRHSRTPMRVVGYVDNEPGLDLGLPLLGGFDELVDVLERHSVDRVIVAFSRQRDSEILQIIRDCDASEVDVDVVPRFFDYVGIEPRVHSMGGMAFLNVRPRRFPLGPRIVKRTFDIVAAAAVLLVLSPVFIAAGVAVALESGRPVFFRQRRVGTNGKEFMILKFRTMHSDAERIAGETRAALGGGVISIDEAVEELKGRAAAAVTRVGGFLRRSSIDELPQLINVLRGDMSLVGPRPLQDYEVAELDRWELYRHRMRPGITGLWQVFGRSDISWDERMNLDYNYVRHWSPLLDLRILFDTIPAILRGRGAV